MSKIEAVYLKLDQDGNCTVYDASDASLIREDVPFGAELIKLLTGSVGIAFIENAYLTLAAHGLLDTFKMAGLTYCPMDDGLPLVICQDPPTIVGYYWKGQRITVLDPENYGLIMDDRYPVQQIIALRHKMGLHYWPSTAAGIANQMLSSKFAGSVSMTTHANAPKDALYHQLSLGGNCGAGFYGKCPGNAFHHYDLSGAYLSAAAMPLPSALLHKCERDAMPLVGNGFAADVTVCTGEPRYPYRPPVEFTDGRHLTTFPVGTFRTTLCGDELCAALSARHVKEVHSSEQWRMEPYLAAYARDMRARIDSCHPSIRIAVKTVALAGLGNFARKDRRWELSDKLPPEAGFRGDWFHLGDDGIERYRRIGSQTTREVVAGYHDESSPQTWAWIAAYVRTRLYDVLRSLGKHVYYWDTDSVITDSRGAAMMEARSDFNAADGWKKKGTAKSLHVWGYRRYSFGNTVSIGLPVSARDTPGGRYVWDSPETWDEAMGDRRNPDGRIVHRHARIRRTYDHGRICEDGRIVPWQVHEHQDGDRVIVA